MRGSLRLGNLIEPLLPAHRGIVPRSCLRAMSSSLSPDEMALTDARGWPERSFKTQVLPMDTSSASDSLAQASKALRTGHLVAFPTETVYGLGASALTTSSALKIFAAKGRPADNPLIVHISSLDMLKTSRIVPDDFKLPDVYRSLADRFWPGALTLLLPASESLPKVVTANLATVGVRMPSNEVARSLIAQSGLPLAAPSANASGRPSPTTAQHVFRDLGGEGNASDVQSQGRLPFILDGGACQLGLESTVVDGLTNPSELRVLRPGGVSVEAIEEALRSDGLSDKIKVKVYGREMERSAAEEATPSTPGMKYRHYSPDARVVLLVDSASLESQAGRDVLSAARALGHFTGSNTLKQVLQRQVEAIWSEKSQALPSEQRPRRLRVGLMSLDDGKISSRFGVQRSEEADSEALGQAYTTLVHGVELEVHPFSLGPISNPEMAARRLFAGLRRLDEGPLLGAEADQEGGNKGCDLILVEAVPEQGIGLAFMNRIGKAASESIVVSSEEGGATDSV